MGQRDTQHCIIDDAVAPFERACMTEERDLFTNLIVYIGVLWLQEMYPLAYLEFL